MLIDTHAHIDFFENPENVIDEAFEAGVEKIIIPGVEPKKFDEIALLAKNNPHIYYALGIHPSEAKTFTADTANKIVKMSNDFKMVAIGEIGLDYYYDKDTTELQKEVFKAQLEIAKTLDLPVLIHDREAHLDTFEILKEFDMKKVIMHCYSGSLEFAKMCIKQGFLIAVGGVVTFKNAKKLKETVKEIPLTSLVLETDCPYLAPHPFRGEENAPKYLPFIAKEVAEIKDITLDEVEETTTNNALKFFNIG